MRVPTIEELILKLTYQVAAGKAHLLVGKGLAEADPVVLNAAHVFFAMSIDAHLYYSQMYAARIHDRTRGAVSLPMLLTRAAKEAHTAKHGSADDVRAAIASSEQILSGLDEQMRALTGVRNRFLAHTDPRTITDPVKVAGAAGTMYPQLQTIFEQTGSILNKFSHLYRDTYVVFDILDQRDYETVIDFVRAGKCEQARRYEAEFGKPAPFSRPSGCK